MDVRLPDGTIVSNVPDGTTQSSLMARVAKMREPAKPDAPARIGAAQEPTWAEKNIAPMLEKVMPPQLADFARNNPVTQGLADPGLGIAQLAANVAGQGDKVNSVIQAREREYQASREDPNSLDLARIATNALNPLALKGLSKLPTTATTVGRIGQGAAVGGASGLATPVTEGEDFFSSKGAQGVIGALAGGAIPGAWEGSKLVGRGVRNVVDPFLPGGAARAAGRLANDTTGSRRDAVVDALMNSKQIVPGSKPTAGQASVPANSAEFASLQRIASESDPSRYFGTGVEGAQEAARKSSLQTVSGSKEALEGAVAARSTAGKENYAAAYAQSVKADPELAALSANPYYKDALPDAFKLAEAKGISPKEDLTEFLHLVKLSLDKSLSKSGDTALSNTEKSAVQNVKTQLVDWMGRKNPAYEHARGEFAAASKPINQMQVGQHLEQKLGAPLENVERAASFAQAVRDAPGTIKRSTGAPMYDELSEVLTPKQEGVVKAILGDLQRDAAYKDLAKSGMSATREKLGVFSDSVPQVGMLERTMMVVNAITRRLEGKASKSTMAELAKRMEDPQEMARIMKAAKPFERQQIVDALMKMQGLGASAAAQGAQ